MHVPNPLSGMVFVLGRRSIQSSGRMKVVSYSKTRVSRCRLLSLIYFYDSVEEMKSWKGCKPIDDQSARQALEFSSQETYRNS